MEKGWHGDPYDRSTLENHMQLKRLWRVMILTIAALAVVVSFTRMVPMTSAEETVTVYKNPT